MTNVLGPHLLTRLLLPALQASGHGRIVTVSTLAGRLHGSPVTANALNPGYVMTDLTRHAGGLLKVAVVQTSFRAQTALDGADTAIWLAASPEVEGITGKFWNKRREVRCRFRDTAAAEQLWRLVEQQTAATVPTMP